MTNSRSSKRFTPLALLVGVVALGLCAGTAEAGRKRVVVLDFEGPKNEKFHDDLIRLIKARYTLIPTDKWNGTAEEMDANKPVDKDIKKVAKKLKVDAIISGKIEKRREDYLIHLKLRAGKTGEVSKPVDTKSGSAKIDDKATSDIKDELLDAIDGLDSNHSAAGGGDGDGDDTEKPVVVKKKKTDDTKKKVDDGDGDGDDGDAAPKHAKFTKHDDDKKGGDAVKKKKVDDGDDGDAKPVVVKKKKKDDTKVVKKDDGDDDSPKPKPVVKKKKTDDDGDGDGDGAKKKVVAKKDDDGEVDGEVDVHAHAKSGVGVVDSDAALSPGQRAVDASFGLSFISRRLSFVQAANFINPAPGYKGAPAPGASIDVAVYPFAIGHKSQSALAGLGLVLSADRVLAITSKKTFVDSTAATQTATLDTSSNSFSIGATFRHPFNSSAMSPVIAGTIRYSKQSFLIQQTIPGTSTSSDIPDVTYTGIEPEVDFHYPISPKLTLVADAGVQVISSTGGIGTAAQYGSANVLGITGNLGADYLIKKNIFVRAMFSLDTIALNFTGNGMQTNMRDGDATTIDISAARDTYIGGVVSVGYLY